MNPQTRSKSPVQANTSRFLLALTLGTWLLASAASVWFWFSPSNDLVGLEWLGSPLFGSSLLAALTTVYYFAVRNRPVRPTVHAVAWSVFSFLVTIANMLTLARFVFGEWKGFQVLPVVIAFELVLIALGVHFSLMHRSRGTMFLLLTWTVVLLLVVGTSMATLGIAFQPGFWTIGFMAELGLGILMGTLVIGYSAIEARPRSQRSLVTSVAWRVGILIGASLLAAHIVLSAQVNVWPVSYAGVALVLTFVVTALRIPTGERAPGEIGDIKGILT